VAAIREHHHVPELRRETTGLCRFAETANQLVVKQDVGGVPQDVRRLTVALYE
jgi:hypothetical protein